MKRASKWLLICGVLALAGCSAETQGSAVSSLQQRRVDASSSETAGAAGEGAEPPVVERTRASNGVIYGVDGDLLTGKVSFAAGTNESGTVDLYCCRAGAYQVYTYEDASCDDPESWAIEGSARIANVSCSNDLGSAPYVRDPSEASTLAFVIYDAAGTALGCADVPLD
jgi:hypothetical protein